MGRKWLLLCCGFGFLYVALGAFGAHALKDSITPDKMKVLSTANQYLGFHALSLGILGVFAKLNPQQNTKWVGILFCSGIFFFSGSLYLYVLCGFRWAAMITPLGGTLFLIAWGSFAKSLWTLGR